MKLLFGHFDTYSIYLIIVQKTRICQIQDVEEKGFCLVFAMSLCASVYMCFVVTCWERADLLALVCGVCCEFVTFPLVSWVRCGT